MKVFNTFSTGLRYGSTPIIDVLIWTASLLRYRSMGYKLKIYCTEKELPFLREWGLFGLYDEIDTDLFEGSEMIPSVDGKKFWSTRKIEAMHHQLSVLKEDAVYSDTDIIMRKPFDLSGDALMWCPEDSTGGRDEIYVPWGVLSAPPGYSMPEYIKKTDGAYNCGIWHFRNPAVFESYRREYYAFAMNNPCEINFKEWGLADVGDLIANNNVWACNAEQRILKAVLAVHNQKVSFVMAERKTGWSKEASHYFHYRVAWRYMNGALKNAAPDALPMLNLTVLECMRTIEIWCAKTGDRTLMKIWDRRVEVRGWRKIDPKGGIYPIKKYV